jgi:CubicO group peptidase (beta-lactamase class C family)
MRPIRIFTLIVTLSLIAFNAMAQTIEQQKTDSVFQQVKKYFNNRQVDSIYNLASDGFKKSINEETFHTVVTDQLFPLGEMGQSTLVSFFNNKIATYKIVFSGITLQLVMSIDENSKLEYFRFIPYTKPEGVKAAPVATSNPLKSDMDKKVDSVARDYIQKENTVGLSIGILKNGKISTYNYGETARGNNTLPTANTIFEIGSITKTFTAAILAWYVNEGKIKLTDTVTKYLPDSVAANPALQGVTVITLSNHTSGLASLPDNFYGHSTDTLNPYKDYTEQLLFTYLKTCKLNSVPGEKYAYSNLGVALLGTILERVSGETYGQMVTDIITKPLQMSSTVLHVPAQMRSRFVNVYNEDGKPTPPWNWDVFEPTGALRSTVSNMLTYAKANMDTTGTTELGKAFALTRQITFHKDVKLGLNWHVIIVNGVEYYFHNGGTDGSSSFLAYNIDRNIAIVILSNCGERVDPVGAKLLKVLE